VDPKIVMVWDGAPSGLRCKTLGGKFMGRNSPKAEDFGIACNFAN